MTPDLILILAGFALVQTGTPGPNNMMVLASGANYGYLRTMPHMVGIWSGLATIFAAMGLGLGQAFALWPPLKTVLLVVSVGYLLYLAFRLTQAGAPKRASAKGRPMTWFEALLFQWVNPKAWAMALSTISAYLPAPTILNITVAIAVFTGAALISNSAWTLMGTQMARFLTSPGRLRAFNWTMAALLVLSLWPVILG